jgi:anti-sigma regulatory factor (Ser/Thr protein kinase)
VRDFGKQVPPGSIRPKEPDGYRPGGLGMHLIHCCIDEVIYCSGDGPGMELTLVKQLST